MKPGELVRIKRASIGVPAGRVGLIIGDRTPAEFLKPNPAGWRGSARVWLVSINGMPGHPRRYLDIDLEVISASR